jgi:hypothetical protein
LRFTIENRYGKESHQFELSMDKSEALKQQRMPGSGRVFQYLCGGLGVVAVPSGTIGWSEVLSQAAVDQQL